MNVREITDVLKKEYPEKYFEKWDSAGIQVGMWDTQIDRILVALEVDDAVIDKAIETGGKFILAHHPLIFGGIKTVCADDVVGRRVMRLIENGISLYSMHTNYDNLCMGRDAAERMGLANAEVFIEGIDGYGIGMIGDLIFNDDMTVEKLCEYIKECFGLKMVSLYGDRSARVTRVAIVPGSGKEFFPEAQNRGAQVLITGDVSHHFGVDAMLSGFNIIDAGHYGLEHIFIEYMGDRMEKLFPNITIERAQVANPIDYI